MTGESIIIDLAGGGSNPPPPVPVSGGAPQPVAWGTWWERYEKAGLAELTCAAKTAIAADAEFLVHACRLGSAEAVDWPPSRIRTGLVVGAVQSGKTAAMLALTAKLLDKKADIIVVLAGTRVSLWHQTMRRLLEHLDGCAPGSARQRRGERLIVPNPQVLVPGAERSKPKHYMNEALGRFEAVLSNGKPVIMVLPKHHEHLRAASSFLQGRLSVLLPRLKRMFRMFVLDDEADDGSILDWEDNKVTPAWIEHLWAGPRHGQTYHERLFATYIAYTATPQANIAQTYHNPLAPRDFCVALRVPAKTGGDPDSGPRSPTFTEPDGLKKHYCGGEVFYGNLAAGQAALALGVDFPRRDRAIDDQDHERMVRAANDGMLVSGLRAYLLSGALRLLASMRDGGLGLSDARRASQVTPAEAKRLPRPHCMLVHPSSQQALHVEALRRVVCWSRGVHPDGKEAPRSLSPEEQVLDLQGVLADFDGSRGEWQIWLERFSATRDAFRDYPGSAHLLDPKADSWDEIRRVLKDEVVPCVRLKVINSHPDADDRPDFAGQDLGDGQRTVPEDIYTIFVSGNVMSRGITIEGLCTSVFTRGATDPVADTQMQMQRWFGYRGAHVHLCRVLCFNDQLDLFKSYHRHDTAMRTEITHNMNSGDVRKIPLILQGSHALATAKVPTRRLPLHPGPSPSVLLLECDHKPAAQANADVLAGLLDAAEWRELDVNGSVRGLYRVEPMRALEVAQVLESLAFSQHRPDENEPEYRRWGHLARQMGLEGDEAQLLRVPGGPPAGPAVPVTGCPYTIAAYLRLWVAALAERPCPGLVPTHLEGTDWDLRRPYLAEPSFHVGIKFGGSGLSTWPRLRAKGVRSMQRAQDAGPPRLARTLWGSRGEGGGPYLGDQRFDYHFNGFKPPPIHGDGTCWRPVGHPGLVLFHVVRREPAGDDAVTVGLCLPLGGPDHIAVRPAVD